MRIRMALADPLVASIPSYLLTPTYPRHQAPSAPVTRGSPAGSSQARPRACARVPGHAGLLEVERREGARREADAVTAGAWSRGRWSPPPPPAPFCCWSGQARRVPREPGRLTGRERERAREREREERDRDRERKEGRRIQGIGAGEPCCATGKNITMLTVKKRLASPVSLPGQPHTRRSLPGLASAWLGPSRRPGRPERAADCARAGKGGRRGLGPRRAGGRSDGRAHGLGGPSACSSARPVPAPPEARAEPGEQLPGRAGRLGQPYFLLGRFPVYFSPGQHVSFTGRKSGGWSPQPSNL